MRILLLSPYDAASHRRWREGLAQALPEFTFVQFALPARHFSWRLRGNSLTYALSSDPRLDGDFDLLLATSMTDLAALRGMRPRLAQTPAVVYFHENQFAYPEGPERTGWLEARVLNLYTALAADHVVFNSAYNRDTFMHGVTALLRAMPDHVPADGVGRREGRSSVLPVPLEEACYARAEKSPRFSIVWNHRWEYDKGADLLLAIVERLASAAFDCQVHLLGQRFRSRPAALTTAMTVLGERGMLGHAAFVEDQEQYRGILAASHLVLSTALHEFQGLAVLEAVAAGCVPLVPDRLVYPEQFSGEYRYAASAGMDEAAAAVAAIAGWRECLLGTGELPVPSVVDLAWPRLAPAYRSLLLRAAGRGP